MGWIALFLLLFILSIVFAPFIIPIILISGFLNNFLKYKKFSVNFINEHLTFVDKINNMKINDYWLTNEEIIKFEKLTHQYNILKIQINDLYDSAKKYNIGTNLNGTFSNRSNKGKEINQNISTLDQQSYAIRNSLYDLIKIPKNNWGKIKTSIDDHNKQYTDYINIKLLKNSYKVSFLFWLVSLLLSLLIYFFFYNLLPESFLIFGKTIKKIYILFWGPPLISYIFFLILKLFKPEIVITNYPTEPPPVTLDNLYNYSDMQLNDNNTKKYHDLNKKEIETIMYTIYCVMTINSNTNINKDEMSYFIKKAISFGYDKNDINAFIQSVNNKEIRIDNLTIPDSKEKKIKILSELLRIVLIDSQISDKEIEFSRLFIQLLGFNSNLIDNILLDFNKLAKEDDKQNLINSFINNI